MAPLHPPKKKKKKYRSLFLFLWKLGGFKECGTMVNVWASGGQCHFSCSSLLGKDLRMDDTKRQDNLRKAIAPLGIKLENLSYCLHCSLTAKPLYYSWTEKPLVAILSKMFTAFTTHQQVSLISGYFLDSAAKGHYVIFWQGYLPLIERSCCLT